MAYGGWHIEQLKFTGENGLEASLKFSRGLSLVYGASNTGKSFAFKALDFMLGGQRELPNISERLPYDRLWLNLRLSANADVSLERAMVGGAFRLHQNGFAVRNLAPKHDASNAENISTFLLRHMNSEGCKVSVDASGTHNNLTFRDIAHVVLTNEITIQSEKSPAEFGERDQVRERNVFKYFLSGVDDSAIIPVIKAKDFRTGNTAKVAVLEELIDQLDISLLTDYPNPEQLEDQYEKLNATFKSIEDEIIAARSSIRYLLDDKRALSSDIANAERKKTEILVSLHSFEQLEKVYESDIERLESLEEASFLLKMDGSSNCLVCGAPPHAQIHSRPAINIEDIRIAAEIEIQKIKEQRNELAKTVEDTKTEELKFSAAIDTMRHSLQEVESKLEEATPTIDEQQRKLSEIMTIRDYLRRGLDLLSQRDWLVKQKTSVEKAKRPKRDATIQKGLSTETAQAFADKVSEVLTAWGFPGENHVTFDLSSYDLIINGKERRNNGKGVRAITHAAFKVALMLFCRERSLPHPGFLVLDTPLLTYRDPMKTPGDTLTPEEQELRNTDLKQRFFRHLGTLGENAQIIVFENIDPPQDIDDYCLVEAFTNDFNIGRQGLL